MGRAGQVLVSALAALLVSASTSSLAVTVGEASGAVGGAGAVAAFDGDDQPIERQISGVARSVFREARRAIRTVAWMVGRAVDLWGSWFKRAAFSIGVAVIAALADGGLVNAWRGEGLRAVISYSTLMLYVYTRLLFSAGVSLAAKLLLIGALAYGVVKRDFVPDRSLVPGRVEDIVLIVIATRAFVYACPEDLINAYAARAVNLKRRVLSLQRDRPR